MSNRTPPERASVDAAHIGELQEVAHGHEHDYSEGSPHIRHHFLRSRVVDTLQAVAIDVLERQGSCRVLEIGAGHGTFTDHIVATGSSVVVTEMSGPSVEYLRRRYRHNDRVQIVADPDGEAASTVGQVDVVACISVLHHIPDYLHAVRSWSEQIRPGGSLVTFQDPLWYPRRSRTSMLLDRAAYLSWRVPRGDLVGGMGTTLRRLRGRLDEARPSDMVEYHVLRDGVDEVALLGLLQSGFDEVEIDRYWATQGAPAQMLNRAGVPPNTFGLVARRRRADR